MQKIVSYPEKYVNITFKKRFYEYLRENNPLVLKVTSENKLNSFFYRVFT